MDVGLRLDTRAPGYVLHADPELIDAHRLELLLDRARTADGDEAAEPLLREALALWPGPALADCGSAALREAAAGRLETLRVEALERFAEHALRTGRARSVTERLTAALAEHPLRESVVRLSALCLHREDRPVLRHRYLSMRNSFVDDYADPETALAGAAETVAEARAVGDGRMLSQALNNLADALPQAGRAADGLAPITESLALLAGARGQPGPRRVRLRRRHGAGAVRPGAHRRGPRPLGAGPRTRRRAGAVDPPGGAGEGTPGALRAAVTGAPSDAPGMTTDALLSFT
ncbi:BTAD domain-containing putative transcriptional regulator [Kitasatospora sp. NPDC058162]|uniref:AfsR/SARP family transcriptional regulator n=1 Tax=Kitasatospora sp. NPDC058162 TaxID=3346362 RepID=UPI0036D82C05